MLPTRASLSTGKKPLRKERLFNLFLDRKDYDLLSRLAFDARVPRAEIIRQALRDLGDKPSRRRAS